MGYDNHIRAWITDANLQRRTYNQYYVENFFEGGIHTQLCGLHGVEYLWLISDSD